MNKVLVKLYVPKLNEQYDIWLPINKQIFNVINLLVKSVSELSGRVFEPINMPILYDKFTAKEYDINMTVKEAGIRNGTEIILI